MAAILSKKSQVIMTTWSHGMLVPEGSQPKKKFLSQNSIEKLVLIILGRFPIKKLKNDDFRPFLVFLSKSPILYIFSNLTPPKTLNSGPKKINHS